MALSASELRIGNWVHIYNSSINNDMRVTDIHEWKICCGLVDAEFEKDEIQPIPLTEEWLLKFHSEEEIKKSGRFPNEITIYDRFIFIWKEEYKYWYVVTAYHKEYLTKIEFVHEYQNFIFALTGEELIIK
jgi:hypothetical protein